MDKALSAEVGMESELIGALNTISKKENVNGVVAAQLDGLCLGTKGVMTSPAAGYVAGVANAAMAMPGSGSPMVAIETDAGTTVVAVKDNVVTAVSSRRTADM
ncbi:uncharacterized protein AMSG_07584 [Thecamonas trahens ATCC 50062]|uniref:Uncharacterized protein n=1 Tax=Thecamonas trahens ATCC 50062 TaxID=461836 RepID=A0A0L0DGS9_THETB|nr:hypothetical protein AMSG_07584 [Thecamonas trahens ATCC 50062]KNC51400.1 hypothetical protein AMSG_07584 [Thecamonas trahens ATCC 50062]|eukprot:XP_013756067.1 hypothetical protein AMSG_07584 [Thecamonas trahens ATCC 50062]